LEAQYLAQVSPGKVVEPQPSKPVLFWCGIPDGGTAFQALQRGWQEEIGSEEEVEFLATIAMEETAGLGAGAIKMDELDCSIRSHILLAVIVRGIPLSYWFQLALAPTYRPSYRLRSCLVAYTSTTVTYSTLCLRSVMQAALVKNMQEREHFLGELEGRIVRKGEDWREKSREVG
jgi:hypothetical protein